MPATPRTAPAEWRRVQSDYLRERRKAAYVMAKPKEAVGDLEVGIKNYMREKFVEAVVAAFDHNLACGYMNFSVELSAKPGAEWMFWLEEETLKRIQNIEGVDACGTSLQNTPGRGTSITYIL